MFYRNLISEIDPTVSPVGVECFMRSDHWTLDNLSRCQFSFEIEQAKRAEAGDPGILRSVADSFGAAGDFDAWDVAR